MDINNINIVAKLIRLLRAVSVVFPFVVTTLLFLPVAKASAESGNTSFEQKPYYFGGSISYNIPHYKKDGSNVDLLKIMDGVDGNVVIKKNRPGFGVLLGTYLDEDISSEVGYSYITRASGTNSFGQNVVSRINNVYLDFLGYKPTSDRLDFIGALGLGRMKAKVTIANNSFVNESDFNKAKYGYRVGAGAQYRLVNNVNARTMFRYQRGKQNFLKSNVSASLDINYLW